MARQKSFLGEHWASLVYVFFALALFGLLVGTGMASSRRLTRQGGNPIAYVSKKDYYQSLDLNLASQATYTNKPVQQANSLGIEDGVQVYTMRFKVPKDGLTEYGLMTLPTAPAPPQGYPVVILCHGYVNPHSYPTTKQYLSDMEFYSQHGFAVLKPDYRGQGLTYYNGSPNGAFYSMAYNTDVMSLIAAVKQTSYLNSSDMSLWGHSMGAYVALRAAVLSPDIKNVILLSGPVGTVKDRFTQYRVTSDLDNPAAMRVVNNMLALHGNPLSDPSYWESTSPLNYLNRSNAVFEINVGADDQIVPPHFSADLVKALGKAGKKYQYFIYPKGSHGLVPQRPLIWKRSLKLLESNT